MGDSYLSSKTALDIPYITFPDLLRKLAIKNYPNKTAFIFIGMKNKRYKPSFGELYDKAIIYFDKVFVQNRVRK